MVTCLPFCPSIIAERSHRALAKFGVISEYALVVPSAICNDDKWSHSRKQPGYHDGGSLSIQPGQVIKHGLAAGHSEPIFEQARFELEQAEKVADNPEACLSP